MRFVDTACLKLFILILLTLLQINKQTEDEYTECVKLSKVYKELDMNCEKFLKKENNQENKANISNDAKNVKNSYNFLKPENLNQNEILGHASSFLLNSYNMYKKNLLELHDIYKNNEDYKGFISAMDKTLREKASTSKTGKTNFRFSDSSNTQIEDVNYDSFFNSDKRKQLQGQFVDTISSDKLRNEIKSQYKNFKDSDMKNIYQKEQTFFKQESDYAKADSKAVDLSNRIYGSLKTLSDRYKDEKPPGLLTVDGHITNDPAGYIKNEEEKFKKTYKEGNNYSYEDVKKLMKLEDIGNEITIMAK